jgi:GT2 family glycosyltransferase
MRCVNTPIFIRELELTKPVDDVELPLRPDGTAYQGARLLVRLQHAPVGEVQLSPDKLSAEEIVSTVWKDLSDSINALRAEVDLPPLALLTARGIAAEDALSHDNLDFKSRRALKASDAERKGAPPSSKLTAPVTVAEIELTSPDEVNYISIAEAESNEVRQALVLVRMDGRPLTTIVVDALGGRVDAASCAAQAHAALAAMDDVPGPTGARLSGVPTGDSSSLAAQYPRISVVIATRERPQSLARCLHSLAQLDYPDYEVIVVDNAPLTDDTAQLIRQWTDFSVQYVREDRRGLAAAHNRGLQEAQGAIVAFTDDDVIVDKRWLREIAEAFRAADDVACVTGLIMAAELQTQPQVVLEAQGNFSKGFRQRVVDLGAHRPADPLFPFTTGKLGSGANMSFDRYKLRAVGGFDPATGVGTVARGGDDLAAFFTVIAAGFQLVYQPTALVWHHHRRDFDSLAGQAYGYGVGLGAYLMSAVCRHPALIGRALWRAPAGLAYAFGPNSPRTANASDSGWPRELTRLERKGLLLGPFAYVRSRWNTRNAPHPFRN